MSSTSTVTTSSHDGSDASDSCSYYEDFGIFVNICFLTAAGVVPNARNPGVATTALTTTNSIDDSACWLSLVGNATALRDCECVDHHVAVAMRLL